MTLPVPKNAIIVFPFYRDNNFVLMPYNFSLGGAAVVGSTTLIKNETIHDKQTTGDLFREF
jgi:hypothetical protein